MTRFHPNVRRRFGVLVLTAGVLAAGDPATSREAWQLASEARLREAETAFKPLAASDRSAALGHALAELGIPPYSEDKLATTRARLEAIVAEKPADETALQARYLLGRFRQLYEPATATDDPPEFLALLREVPSHRLAQLAALKLVLHRLYAPGTAPSDAQRLAAAEAMAARIELAPLRRDYHQAMGDAYLYFGDRRVEALRHFRAAEELGISDASARATVLVQIGELSRLLGQPAAAIAAYRKFLQEFKRDIRSYEVSRRLAALEGKS